MAPGWDAVLPALISGGFGAGLGAVGAALVTTFGNHGEARAHAADMISDAAGGLASQQAALIERLEKRTIRQAHAIVALTDVLDELLPQLALPPAELAKLRKVITASKLAL